jgi:transcriptional regulator with XRE-family HTH domain
VARQIVFPPLPEVLSVLGKRIAELRKQRGFSQEDFAEECGLHRTEMGLLERGKTIPRLDTLLLVSKSLKLTISELISSLPNRNI